MSSLSFKSGVTVALAASTLLGLAACSDPGAAAAGGTTAAPSSSSGVKQFNLSPQQDRIKVTADAAAAKLVPDAIKKDGKLPVAVSPFAAPLAVYATDNKTPVGNEVDIAVALAEALAARRGYRQVYLTTGPRQPEAKHLYLNTGYEAQFDLSADPETIGALAFTKDLPNLNPTPNPTPNTNPGSLSVHPGPRDRR